MAARPIRQAPKRRNRYRVPPYGLTIHAVVGFEKWGSRRFMGTELVTEIGECPYAQGPAALLA